MEPSKDFGNPANRVAMPEPTVRYACQCCGNCCKWPGDVCIEPDEIAPIARFLGMSEENFIQCYTRLRSNRQGLSLMDKENHECVMLDNNTCRIHPAKPEQCRGFPNKWNFPGWRQICPATPVHSDDLF